MVPGGIAMQKLGISYFDRLASKQFFRTWMYVIISLSLGPYRIAI